jgi:hypothetical protein
LLGSAGLLLLSHARQTAGRFPGTELERGLERLFALLLPVRRATSTATARVALIQQLRLAGLRRGARRWGQQLQLITTDGYETASRLSALRAPSSGQDDAALAAAAVRALKAERTRAGADPARADDAVSILAYGLGARPTGIDFASLDDLLIDLGLSDDGDELRRRFDELLAAQSGATPELRNEAERSLFSELAGASFVLGAAARILELAARTPTRVGAQPLTAAG